jgi:hypothetical protein
MAGLGTAAARDRPSPAQEPGLPPARHPCSWCPGRTVPGRTALDRESSRFPAEARLPATSPCCGRRAHRPVRVPSPVPAQVPGPATILYPAGWRQTRGPPPASCRPYGRQDRVVPAVRPSLVPAPHPRPARIQCSSRSGRAVPGQLPSQAPAEARRPATTRCSAGSGRTARPPGGRQAVRHRTGLCCCTGRRRTASGRLPGRTPRPWAPGPDRTAPGWPAQALVRARMGQVLAAWKRTGLARSRLAPAQVPLARNPAGRAATVAPARRHPDLAEVPARYLASQDPAGRGRPDPGQAARLPAGPVPRWPPTPGRTGIPVAARSAPPPVATRAPAHHAAVPAGPVPVRESAVPETPVPAAGPGTPVPGTRVAVDRPAPAARRPARRDPGPARVRRRTARAAAAGRRIPRGAARAGASGAAGPDGAGPGEPAVGGLPSGAAVDGQRLASRPRDAARAGRPTRGRALPACPNVAGSRAWAACRAPAGRATALAAGPRGGAVRVPCRSRSPGSWDQRGTRQLPGRSPAGKCPAPRRQRRWPGPACPGQARCPDDSPGTSWTHRAALATPDRV